MRWRLGLLQDAAAIEKQVQRDSARELAKRHKHEAPTVKTEAQTKADDAAAAKAAKEPPQPPKPPEPPKAKEPRIRPLSEAKAIESGANFISETFLFGVAASLILFESWRSRRKDSARRDVVQDRLNDLEESEAAARKALVELEREVLHLRAKHNIPNTERILPKEVYEPKEEDEEISKGWLSRIASFINRDPTAANDEKDARARLANNAPGPAESILVQADKEMETKRKQRDAEQAEQSVSLLAGSKSG
jgi:optic atrophy 3 protein